MGIEKTVNIKLDTMKGINDFVKIAEDTNGDFKLIQDSYIVNAKSFLSIFGLNLSKTIQLIVRTKEDDVFQKIEQYIVE